MRSTLAVLLVVLASCGAAIGDTAPAKGSRPASLQKRCESGHVAAVISHRRVCLRAGQRCEPGRDRQYRRYGFRCPLTGRLERIPPSAGTVVADIRGSLGGYVTAGESAIWLLGPDAQVLRVDPERNAVVDRIQLPLPESPLPFSGLSGIVAGDGGVWVSLASHDEVVRIDPATDAIVARIPVGEAPAGIAVSPGSVWVANRFGHSVSRIDASTNRVVATITFEGQSDGPSSIASGAGAIWVVVPDLGGVVRINPATNAIEALIPVRLSRDFAPLNGIAADTSAGVWVAGVDLIRIDPDRNRVVATVPTHALPVGVAIGLGSVWETSWAGRGVPGLLRRINPSTNAVAGESNQGASYSAVAVGFASVWVQGSGLLRVHPR